MHLYVARRIGALVPVLLGVSILAFSLGHVAPGDPAALALQRALGTPSTDAQVDHKREELGLDRSLVVQYADWIGGALRGNLGDSWATQRDVAILLAERTPRTLALAGAALLISLVVGIPLGMVSVHLRGTAVDHLLRVTGLLWLSFPSFFVAYVLIFVFGVRLNLLPAFGAGSLRHLVLPSATLGLSGAALLMRLTRSALLEAIEQPYIVTARAKGQSELKILYAHALRSALLAIVSVVGLQLGFLATGTVIIEWVFAWPGLGKLAVDAIYARDYPVVQGFVLFTGLIFVLVNLATDLAYGWVDPRVRLEGRPT